MRIGLISTYPPIECGIGTYTSYLNKGLRALDNETFVVSQIGAQGKKVFPVYQAGSPTLAADIFHTSNSMTPDVVHIQHEFGLYGQQRGVNVIELIVRYRMVDCPVATTLHTVNPDLDHEEQVILRNILRESSAVIVHEQVQKDILEKHFGKSDHVHVVEHGVREMSPIPNAKDKLGLDGKKVILLCGYFRPTKGFHKIVEMFPKIHELDSEAMLVVAGKFRTLQHGEYQAQFFDLLNNSPVKDNIRVFRGQFPQHTFDTIVSAADVVVLPYEKGGQSGVMAQCFAMGKPVVCSNLPAFRILAERSGGGVVSESDSEYPEKILSVLNDEEISRKLRHNIADYVATRAGWTTIAREHINVYHSIVKVPYGNAKYIYIPKDE